MRKKFLLGRFAVTYAVLSLMWTAYYCAKRASAGLFDATDAVVCGAFAALGVGILLFNLVVRLRRRCGVRPKR